MPRSRMEFGAVRRVPAAGGREPAADSGSRCPGAAVRRPGRRRDRVDHRCRGRDRVRHRGRAAIVGRLGGLHPGDRDRRVRTVDRQCARRLFLRPDAGRPTRHRRAGSHRDPVCAARRQRVDRRAVRRSDRPRLRQGEHLHGAQTAVHAVQPGVPAGRRAARQVGSAIALQGRPGGHRCADRRADAHLRQCRQGRVTGPVPALIFDCDGVLADTERYGHLPAFNQTFAAFGIPVQWSDEEYARKVLIGGGKERMASLLTPEFVAANNLPADEAGRRDMLAQWHRYKTAAYTDLVAAGAMPGRPGIARVVGEAAAAGWQLAVASTSAEPSVRAVLDHAVGGELAADFAVFAGDIVPAKKPDPALYQLAVESLGVQPDQVIVVEDSANGLRAALGAGLRCVVTVSTYTVDEDFSGAALVVSSLGDPDGERTVVLADPHDVHPEGFVSLDDLAALLSRNLEKP